MSKNKIDWENLIKNSPVLKGEGGYKPEAPVFHEKYHSSPHAPSKDSDSPKHLALTIKSISLTPATIKALELLAEKISKKSGKKVAASAVIRGLLRYAVSNVDESALVKVIEAENTSGDVVWGRQAAK